MHHSYSPYAYVSTALFFLFANNYFIYLFDQSSLLFANIYLLILLPLFPFCQDFYLFALSSSFLFANNHFIYLLILLSLGMSFLLFANNLFNLHDHSFSFPSVLYIFANNLFNLHDQSFSFPSVLFSFILYRLFAIIHIISSQFFVVFSPKFLPLLE